MAKPFSIQDYLLKNKIEMGSIKKEVGDTVYKGGHNDYRKTNYDVNIVDGKLDLNTHREVITESKTQINKPLNEGGMKIYKKSKKQNIIDFYYEQNPSKKQFDDFKKNGIGKINGTIFISDPYDILS